MTLTGDMSDLRGQLIRAKAEGKYCSGCAFDRFLWLAEQAPIPRSSRARAARDWLYEFEEMFEPEDTAQLAKDAHEYLRQRGHDPREWDSTFVFSARLTVAWRWRGEFERQFERGVYDSLLRDPQE